MPPLRDVPVFSIIVPAYNEERFIRSCLDALRSLDYPMDKCEVIVVDNGSTDQTVAIASEYADAVLIYPQIGVGALRNRGANAAKGSVLAFIDADCIAPADWLTSAAHSLAIEPCLTGNSYDIPEHPHWIERAWSAQEPRGRRRTRLIPAGNLFISRHVFLQCGGFEETLISGEDAEFCERVSRVLPIIADDRVRVIHLGNPKTLQKFLLREIWHGMGACGSLRHNWMDKPLFATILVGLLTICQLVGLALLPFGLSGKSFVYSTAGVITVLLATIGYRLPTIRHWKAVLPLLVLYYVYYIGRSLSLLMLLMGTDFRRREK